MAKLFRGRDISVLYHLDGSNEETLSSHRCQIAGSETGYHHRIWIFLFTAAEESQ